ncbi:hypothetical protein KU6B_02960 [Mameliella alba]|nr:hypothetical protein KU6B_02960 [Mameliella alba]GGF84565.1 hypothetical protein GCM10011319_50670 [Mameliella alba]
MAASRSPDSRTQAALNTVASTSVKSANKISPSAIRTGRAVVSPGKGAGRHNAAESSPPSR